MPRELTRVPFEIRNEIQDDKYVLYLSGTVDRGGWWYSGEINAKSVRDELEGVEQDIVIRLNSPGGDVFEGIEIYNYLKDHPSHVTVEVTGTAASAASVIAMGADKVVMNTGTEIMIHKASTYAWGNDDDLEEVVEMLRHTNGLIVDVYAERTGQDKNQINEWLKKDTYFNPEEAITYGFADEIKVRNKDVEDEIDIVALINRSVANSLKEQMKVENKLVETPKKSFIEKLRKGDK